MDSFSDLTYHELCAIDKVVVQFEQDYASGAAPPIEELVEASPAKLRASLLRELLSVALEVSDGKMEMPQVETYVERFPEFDATVREVFAASQSIDSKPQKNPSLQPNEMIGGYRVLNLVGRGGMGVVYQAIDTKLDRVVALKMLHPSTHFSKRHNSRFMQEATATARLVHQNIVSIYSFGFHKEQPYIAMEFVDGSSLDRLIHGKSFKSRTAAELCAILARAIHYSHEQGVIHRDLKPANILINLNEDGDHSATQFGEAPKRKESSASRPSSHPTFTSNAWTPKITDFGLARDINQGIENTATGEILGTAQYMSPEQARGERLIDGTSDVYSLGVILYEMLTGKPALRGATTLDTLKMVLETDPVPPRSQAARVHVDVSNICMKCLEKDQRRRYSSAAELAEDLERFLSNQPVLARHSSIPRQLLLLCKRHKTLSLTIAVSVLFLITLSLFYVSHLAVTNAKLASANAELSVANDGLNALNENLARSQREVQVASSKAIKERDAAREQLERARIRELAVKALVLKDQSPAVALLLGREAVVRSAALSGREETASKETLLRILSELGGMPIGTHLSSYKDTLLFSATGDYIVSGGNHGILVLHQFDKGRVQERHQVDVQAPISALAVRPDGMQIAVGTTAGEVLLVGRTGEILSRVQAHSGRIAEVNFSSDKIWLASASTDGSAAVWDLRRGLEETMTKLPHPQAVASIDFSPGCEEVITVCKDNRLRRWSITAEGLHGSPLVLDPKNNELFDGFFSRSGDLFISSGFSRKPQVWKLKDISASGRPTLLMGNTGRVLKADVSLSERWVASCSLDKTIRVWDLNGEDPTRTITAYRHGEDRANYLCFSPIDDNLFATAGNDRTIRLWACEQQNHNTTLPVLRGHSSAIQVIRFSPDGKFMVSRDTSGEMRIWNLNVLSSEATRWRHPKDRNILAVAVLPDGTYATTGHSRKVHFWDAESLEGVGFKPRKLDVFCCLSASPDGRWLAGGSMFDSVRLWNQAQDSKYGTVLYRKKSRQPIRSISIDGKSRYLAAACPDGTTRVWDLTTEQKTLLASLRPTSGELTRVAFSPCGRFLAGGVSNGSMVIWQCTDGIAEKEVLLADVGQVAINDIEFSADGTRMVTAHSDGVLRLWEVPAENKDLTDSSHWNARELRGHSSSCKAIATDSSAEQIVSITEDGTTELFYLDSAGTLVDRLVIAADKAQLTDVAYDRQRNRILTTNSAGVLRIWQTDTEAIVKAASQIAGRELSAAERERYLEEE